MVEINFSFYHYKLKCQKLKKQNKTLSSINIPIFKKKKLNGSNKYMFFTEKTFLISACLLRFEGCYKIQIWWCQA